MYPAFDPALEGREISMREADSIDRMHGLEVLQLTQPPSLEEWRRNPRAYRQHALAGYVIEEPEGETHASS